MAPGDGICCRTVTPSATSPTFSRTGRGGFLTRYKAQDQEEATRQYESMTAHEHEDRLRGLRGLLYKGWGSPFSVSHFSGVVSRFGMAKARGLISWRWALFCAKKDRQTHVFGQDGVLPGTQEY
jgi:hypothetical protein